MHRCWYDGHHVEYGSQNRGQIRPRRDGRDIIFFQFVTLHRTGPGMGSGAHIAPQFCAVAAVQYGDLMPKLQGFCQMHDWLPGRRSGGKSCVVKGMVEGLNRGGALMKQRQSIRLAQMVNMRYLVLLSSLLPCSHIQLSPPPRLLAHERTA